MNARKLLKECREVLLRGQADEQMAMVASIDAYLAAPHESAMEVVEKIREIHEVFPDSYAIDDLDAAALIESYGRRVPRAMLDKYAELYFQSYDLRIDKDGLQKRTMDALAANHGVEVEG